MHQHVKREYINFIKKLTNDQLINLIEKRVFQNRSQDLSVEAIIIGYDEAIGRNLTLNNNVQQLMYNVEHNKIWHYVSGSESIGPISLKELLVKYDSNQINPKTMVWKSGYIDWKYLDQTNLILDVSGYTQAPPPPPVQSPSSSSNSNQNVNNQSSFLNTSKFADHRLNQHNSYHPSNYTARVENQRANHQNIHSQVAYPSNSVNQSINHQSKGESIDYNQNSASHTPKHPNQLNSITQKPPNNLIVWLIAFSPLLNVLIRFALLFMEHNPDVSIIYVSIFCTILCLLDLYLIHRQGYTNKTGRMIFIALVLVPGYLFARARLTDRKYSYAITNSIILILLVLIQWFLGTVVWYLT